MVQDDATTTELQVLARKMIEQIHFVEVRSMSFRMLEIHVPDGTTLNVEPMAKCDVRYQNYRKIAPVTPKDYGTFGEFSRRHAGIGELHPLILHGAYQCGLPGSDCVHRRAKVQCKDL
jgi:hypothetical protein